MTRIQKFADINAITQKIIGGAIEVHRQLGPGLLESTYESCFVYELEQFGLRVQRQVLLPIVYKGLQLEQAYRIDLLVEDMVIVELKAVETIIAVHEAQVLSYLKHANKRIGLLLNFNVKLLKNGGIRRFVRD